MGFRSGAYARVWKVEKGNGNFYVADMSTSKKVKDRNGNVVQENGKDKYETDWSNKFVRLVGTAAKQAESLSNGTSVKIDSCEVTNKYDKKKNTTYTNYVIFAFTEDGQAPTTNNKTLSDGFMNIPDGVDEELPFA
jgi:hypothetical protein